MNIKPLWESTLTKDMPAGPLPGQEHFPVGSKIFILTSLFTERFGNTTFTAPDPVYFYLNNAEKNLSAIPSLLKALTKTKQLTIFPSLGKKVNNLKTETIYEYFERVMAVIIFTYSAIEAFSNQHIPSLESYPFDPESKRKKDYKTKADFERLAPTAYKLRFLSQNIKGQDITKEVFWHSFIKLADLRHELIHLKTKGQAFLDQYLVVYKNLIDTNIDELFSENLKLFVFFENEFLTYEKNQTERN